MLVSVTARLPVGCSLALLIIVFCFIVTCLLRGRFYLTLLAGRRWFRLGGPLENVSTAPPEPPQYRQRAYTPLLKGKGRRGKRRKWRDVKGLEREVEKSDINDIMWIIMIMLMMS